MSNETSVLTPFQQARAMKVAAKAAGKTFSKGQIRFSDEIVKARRHAITRRNQEARRRALAVLQMRHQDEFNKLYAAETLGVLQEKGPLPGDDQFNE